MTAPRPRTGFICPPSHSHGMDSTCKTSHGCECESCAEWRRQYDRNRRRLQGSDVHVDAGPTRRRLQALARVGWSPVGIQKEAGLMNAASLSIIRSGGRDRVQLSTARKIEAFYRQVCMTPRTGGIGKRTVAYARKLGWHDPTAWADIDAGILD